MEPKQQQQKQQPPPPPSNDLIGIYLFPEVSLAVSIEPAPVMTGDVTRNKVRQKIIADNNLLVMDKSGWVEAFMAPMMAWLECHPDCGLLELETHLRNKTCNTFLIASTPDPSGAPHGSKLGYITKDNHSQNPVPSYFLWLEMGPGAYSQVLRHGKTYLANKSKLPQTGSFVMQERPTELPAPDHLFTEKEHKENEEVRNTTVFYHLHDMGTATTLNYDFWCYDMERKVPRKYPHAILHQRYLSKQR